MPARGATGSFTRSSTASNSICFCPRLSRTRTATSSRDCWRTPAYWERCACKDRCVVLDGLDSHRVRSRNQLKVEHINYEMCFGWPKGVSPEHNCIEVCPTRPRSDLWEGFRRPGEGNWHPTSAFSTAVSSSGI